MVKKPSISRRPLIRLTNSHSVDAVERFLAEIENSSECDISLGPTIRNVQFGGLAALIQLLITWAQRNQDGVLVTYIPTEEQAAIQMRTLVGDDHGLAALLVAPRITMADRETEIDAFAYEYARARLNRIALGRRPITSGPGRLLICADDMPEGLTPQLYSKHLGTDPTVQSENKFVNFFSGVAARLIGTHQGVQPLETDTAQVLGCIVHELFKNTHDWATKSWQGVRIPRSIRGVRLELIRGSRERLLYYVGSCRTLQTYVEAVCELHKTTTQSFMEISVFDSGSGIAEVFGRHTILPNTPLQDEYRSVIMALAKWSSTSAKTRRGVGLYRVMRTLSLASGLLRIRTGRLNLVRSFVAAPYEEIGSDAIVEASILPDLMDWNTGTLDLSESPAVAGTLLSMLIPLAKNSR